MRTFLAISSAASVAVVLQGCGSSGDAPTPAPAPAGHMTTTPSAGVKTTSASVDTTQPASTAEPVVTSTAAPAPAPTPATPMDGDSIAQWMNELYTGYSPDDDTSPLGVTIQMHQDFAFYCGGGCFSGNADCRVSTSIYNHRVLVMQETNSIAITTVNGAGSGVLFNQTAVEAKLAKCSYQFDGATFNRLNGGCGCGAGGRQDCDDPMCAYLNVDPESNENATGTSPHVDRCSCESPQHFDATATNQEQCFWKGPSFYLPDGAAPDGTRQMLAQRVANSEGVDDLGNGVTRIKNEYWNEIVIDANVLLEELRQDAVSTVPAMVYTKGSEEGKATAIAMAESMASQYSLAAPVPVIAIDMSKDVSTGGPFVFEAEDSAELIV